MNDFEEAETGTKMADNLTLKNMTKINKMKSDYKNMEEMKAEVMAVNIEEFLQFNNNGRFDFYKCESCGGPMLGHMEAKCRGLKGARYEEPIVKAFKDWFRGIPELKVAVDNRERRKEERKAERKAESMRVMMEGMNKPQGQTAQIVKPRLRPT